MQLEMLSRRAPRVSSGFTLLEILIALVITAVGLLGLAKMQALAVSATKESGSRGLVALQAGSLANMMYANEAYWATALAPSEPFTISGLNSSNADLNAGVVNGCTAKCSPVEMAAADVKTWAQTMNQQFPSYIATVKCDAWSETSPVNCLIYINWSDRQVAINSKVADSAPVETQSFSINVKP